eukprot:scaffold4319_cov133-Skeletonema_dohrnii-CCMP3373.AAC.12
MSLRDEARYLPLVGHEPNTCTANEEKDADAGSGKGKLHTVFGRKAEKQPTNTMKEGDGLTTEGEPASASAAATAEVNAEVARANNGKERESKLMDRKAFVAVDSFEARLRDKLLTGSLNPNTNINADMASDDDDASYPSGLKEEAPKKDGHVIHEVVKGEGDLSDQSKGTAPASSGDVISNSAAVVRGDEKMISAYVTTINEDNIPIQPGVVFVPEPDSRGGIHTRSHSAHEHEYEESDADADSDDDIENQTQTLIEAY